MAQYLSFVIFPLEKKKCFCYYTPLVETGNRKAEIMMQKLFAVAVAGAASMLYGNEIMFTGLDASNPTNLSSSANWSAPPSADVVGVIDLSKTSAAGYVVDGTGLALKGLRIEGAAGKTITLGGASVLTLGESGYK